MPAAPQRPRFHIGFGAGVMVWAAVVGAGWWLWQRTPLKQQQAATSRPFVPRRDGPAPPAAAPSRAAGPSTATVVGRPKPATAPKPSRPSPPAESDVPAAATATEEAAPPDASRTSDVTTNPAAADAPVEHPQISSVTYSAADLDVTPPTAVSSQMLGMLARSSPGNRPEVLTIAVVVNENGTVDSVRAVNVPVTVGESVMLTAALSAVKAWHFRPAMKDGEPVRYRQIVPVRIGGSIP